MYREIEIDGEYIKYFSIMSEFFSNLQRSGKDLTDLSNKL